MQYIHIIHTILHRNCISWKNTINVHSSIVSPRTKHSRQIKSNTTKIADGRIESPLASITKSSGMKDSSKLIEEARTFEIGKIYLGTYTFLINDALLVMEVIPEATASEKKLKNTIPISRYAA